MRRSRMLLLLGIAALTPSARSAHAQACPGWDVGPASTTTAQSTIDGPHGGHPATSSASSSTIYTGTNLGTTGALTIDHGSFDSTTYAGGFLLITGIGSNSALARAQAVVVDCLLISGYAGSGVLHIPIHVTGDAFTEWSLTSDYQPTPPDTKFAGNQLSFGCLAYGPQAIACTGSTLPIDEFTTQIDATVELVFQFTFDTPTALRSTLNATSSLGYSANGDEGTLTATASLTAHGVLEPAYVTDTLGSPLPNATITAGSGFDYLTAPEPSAAAAASMLALGLLSTLRSAGANRRSA